MHLHTIVKVTAKDEAEAIEKVENLLTSDGDYRIDPFDYIDDTARISEEVKTEADFQKVVEQEKIEAEEYLKRSEEEKSKPNGMRGYLIRMAGESLSPDRFWSTERLAYNYDFYETNGDEEGKVFYVETDRHY